MPKLLDLIYKYKQIIKYLFAGGLAALTDFAILFLLVDVIHIWYVTSSVLAFAIAFGVSFYLQKFWTFRDGDLDKIYKQLAVYLAVGLANLGLNTLFIYILVDKFGLWYMLAQVLISGVIAIWSFLIYKFLIFKK